MAEHSSTPWTADDIGSVIIATDGNVIACNPNMGRMSPSKQDVANFKHIEIAVNAYDKLLEAVTLSAATFEHGRPGVAAAAHQACREALVAIYWPEETK